MHINRERNPEVRNSLVKRINVMRYVEYHTVHIDGPRIGRIWTQERLHEICAYVRWMVGELLDQGAVSEAWRAQHGWQKITVDLLTEEEYNRWSSTKTRIDVV